MKKALFYPLVNLKLTSLLVQKDLLWIGTKSGLYRWKFNSDKLEHYVSSDKKKSSISDNRIQDLAVDNNSNLWIATASGLNTYNKNKDSFERYTKKNYADDGFVC